MIKQFLFTLLTIFTFSLFSEETHADSALLAQQQPEEESKELTADQIANLSESFGHMLAQHIDSLGINFDIPRLVKGIEEERLGKQSPMDEMQCIETIGFAREQAMKKLSKQNLQIAETFLAEAAKNPEFSVLEKDKLYFRVDKKGEGAEVVSGNSPRIRYKGSFIDGKIFGESKTDDHISLDETIPGFSRGILGMKEGEKRTLYIHPELAYGTNGQLPPNSLLVFEIELIRAHEELPETSPHIATIPDQPEDLKEISQTAIPSPCEEESVMR